MILLFFVHPSVSKAQGADAGPEREISLIDDPFQTSGQIWSKPVLLFQVEDGGEIHHPFIIPDAYGNLHVFWTVAPESEDDFGKIYYMRLDAIGWTTPVDVIAVPLARSPTATIGQDNYIYLIWNGFGGISYSRAPIGGAEFAQNWSEPVLLTNANINASIATSPAGTIYFAYPGEENSGAFQQFLEANSLNWSSPRMISSPSLINTAPDYVQVGVSNNGTLHVVWTEFYYPVGWPPRGIFYSRSTDGGDTWSVPTLLAGDGYDQVNISVLDDNNIHVAWNGMAGVGGRYHRWSSDGGQTWSDTNDVIQAGEGGTEGLPQILGDQTGTVHMLTTRLGVGCALYTYFKDQRWANPTCVSGEKGLVEETALAISEGNKLHAVFWEDRKSLWYVTKVTDAPWIPPQAMESELVQPAPSQIAAELPDVTPTAVSMGLLVDQQLDAPPQAALSPWQIMMIGLSPVLLLIIWIAASKIYKNLR